jgi:hypothetical protein
VNLIEIQRNVRDWLVAESEEAAARLGVAAAPGLSVHLNTYRGQLLACLSETFPVVHAWLGDAAFEAAAATHIDQVPPRSYTLDDYARDFPDTLKGLYRQDAEVFELAELERTLAELFVATDCTPVTLETIKPDKWAQIDWDRAVLNFVPTLQLLPVTTNVAAIWSAIKDRNRPPAVEQLTLPTQLLFWRNGYSPSFRSLESNEADAMAQVSGGMAFGALCAHLVERCGADEAPQLAASFLGQWLRDGLIAEVV